MAPVKCGMVAALMEDIAPKSLAEDWDNVGLMVGNNGQEVKKIMVALDLPIWVLDEAIEKDVDMIVTHHPLIFSGIKKVNTDTSLGRKIIKLIEEGISVYSSHTNFDMAKDGLNDIFAKQLGLSEWEVLLPSHEEKLYKVVVYVPLGSEGKVMESLSKASGIIGNYSSCSFRTEGTGTFKPEEGSNPHLGKLGKLEEVQEYRLEVMVSEKHLKKAIREMKKAHPYEEPAYDVYELKNQGVIRGIGRVGELPEETSLLSYGEFIKKTLDLDIVRYAQASDKKIKRVALVNGSGNRLVFQAKRANADVLVTGDMQYHQIIEALEEGLSIIDAGHFGTEKVMIKSVSDYLKATLKDLRYEVEVIESKSNIDLFLSI